MVHGRDFRPKRKFVGSRYGVKRRPPFKGRASRMIEKGLDLYRLYKGVSPYAATVLKGLYGVVNSEMKYVDSSQTGVSISNTGGLYSLSVMAQGDTQETRQGQKILAKDLLLRGSLQVNASATSTRVRMIIGVDKMGNGAYPTTTDILDSASVYAPLDIDDSQGRFVILYDRLYNLETDGKDSVAFKIYKKLDFHIAFKGTTATEADIGKNYIWILFLTDEAVNTPTVSYIARMKYYDN